MKEKPPSFWNSMENLREEHLLNCDCMLFTEPCKDLQAVFNSKLQDLKKEIEKEEGICDYNLEAISFCAGLNKAIELLDKLIK